MAATLKGRSGSSLRAEFQYQQADGTLIDTSGYTTHIQIRAEEPPGRIILETQEYTGTLPEPTGTIFTRIEPGKWRLFLGKRITSTLPPTSVWEIEMTNNVNSDDVVPVASGVIVMSPQSVVGVE